MQREKLVLKYVHIARRFLLEISRNIVEILENVSRIRITI